MKINKSKKYLEFLRELKDDPTLEYRSEKVCSLFGIDSSKFIYDFSRSGTSVRFFSKEMFENIESKMTIKVYFGDMTELNYYFDFEFLILDEEFYQSSSFAENQIGDIDFKHKDLKCYQKTKTIALNEIEYSNEMITRSFKPDYQEKLKKQNNLRKTFSMKKSILYKDVSFEQDPVHEYILNDSTVPSNWKGDFVYFINLNLFIFKLNSLLILNGKEELDRSDALFIWRITHQKSSNLGGALRTKYKHFENGELLDLIDVKGGKLTEDSKDLICFNFKV